jgi:chromosome segregation ATPase
LQETSKNKDTEKDQRNEQIQRLKKNMKENKKSCDNINESKIESERIKKVLEKEIKQQQIHRTTLTLEKSQAKKALDKLQNRRQQLIQKHEDAHKNKEVIINSVHQLDRQVVDTKKLIVEDRHYIDDLKKAKEVLDRDLNKAQDNNKVILDEIQKIEQAIEEKEKEVSAKGKELDKLEKRIQGLEKEKEKYGK